MSRFLLVHQNAEAIDSVKQIVTKNPAYQLIAHVPSGKDALVTLAGGQVQVVLFEVNQPGGDGFQVIKQITEKHPEVYIVPILQGTEGGDVWQKILQMNLREVIIATSDPVTIQGVLATAAKRAEENGQKFCELGTKSKSYVVTIAGARGGVGKSTIAINLAVAMAKQKADLSLIDFSMSAGDFVAMLDDVPRNTLADAITQGTGLDAGYLKNILTDHSFGFRYLACPNQDFDYYSFDYDSAVNFIAQLRTITEYALIDTGSFDLPSTIAAIENSDICFLITSRDLARLFALQRFIKTLEQREISKDKLKIIINNAEVGTEISEKEIEDVLQHPVTAYLPSSPLPITFSINSGKPLLQTKPDLPFCAVISKLAEITKERWQDS